MNPLTNVKNLQKINERELKMGLVGHEKSWHSKYKNSAWIYFGGVSFDLTEGDLLCIFSQYGEIVNINLVRDKNTGKSRGFGFLCYEDQRSTILAVDNFNGAKICNRIFRVDHVENYKPPKDSEEHDELTKLLHEKGCAPEVVAPQSEPEDAEVSQSEAGSEEDKDEKARRKQRRKEKKKAKKAKKKLKKEQKRKLKALKKQSNTQSGSRPESKKDGSDSDSSSDSRSKSSSPSSANEERPIKIEPIDETIIKVENERSRNSDATKRPSDRRKSPPSPRNQSPRRSRSPHRRRRSRSPAQKSSFRSPARERHTYRRSRSRSPQNRSKKPYRRSESPRDRHRSSRDDNRSRHRSPDARRR